MDVTRLFRVLEICIPVFVLIGIGKFLDFKGIMNNKIEQNIIIQKVKEEDIQDIHNIIRERRQNKVVITKLKVIVK